MRARVGRLLVRVGGVAILAVALAGVVYANHSWGNYHWARPGNLDLDLGDNVSTDWDPYLDTAKVDWTSAVLTLTKVAGGTSSRRCKPTSGRVEVCADNYGYNGWLGLAQIWVDGDHITQAISKMNDSYFSLATYDTPAWRRMVMCQEVGHTFGLSHQDENFNNTNLGSCMDYTSNPAGPPSNEHPNAHDYDQLDSIYAHADDTAPPPPDSGPGNGRGRGNKMPPAMDDIDFASPAQWGKLVRGSQAQGFSIYELDFGGGHKVITHVLWVRPGNPKN